MNEPVSVGAAPSRCVVLVPVAHSIEPECEEGLRALERLGYEVRRAWGSSAVDVARSQLATRALADGFDELMWVDSDISFPPDAVAKLRAHGLPFVAGVYAKKGPREFACEFPPGTASVRFGAGAEPRELVGCGFGFVLTRRAVFEAVLAGGDLPVCGEGAGGGMVPYFRPALVDAEAGGRRYLAEDYAFCRRARDAGVRIVADLTIRLGHVGRYAYTWEDVGADKPRYGEYLFHFAGAGAGAGHPAVGPPSPPSGFRGAAAPLGPRFPRMGACVVSYPANADSLRAMLEDFRRSDWRGEPAVFVQPGSWPTGADSASRNYELALRHAWNAGWDFALVLEDDVRVCRRLRACLLANPLVARDQCDHLGLYIPDVIESPWQRREPRLGYRLARPLYSGPNRLWERSRLWGSQAYLLSRRLIGAALERWAGLAAGQDARLISVCSELRVPMWYADPCLVEHAPLRSAFATPHARAPDFDPDYGLEVAPGFQPPEAVPGWLTEAEGALLYKSAAGLRVLELNGDRGRATVCLAQSAARVTGISDGAEAAEAAEWLARFGLTGRVEILSDAGEAGSRGPFDLVLIDGEHDDDSVARDIDSALRVLAPGGLLAFHDYPDPGWPGVRRAVDRRAGEGGWVRVAQEGYLGVFRVPVDALDAVTAGEVSATG